MILDTVTKRILNYINNLVSELSIKYDTIHTNIHYSIKDNVISLLILDIKVENNNWKEIESIKRYYIDRNFINSSEINIIYDKKFTENNFEIKSFNDTNTMYFMIIADLEEFEERLQFLFNLNSKS